VNRWCGSETRLKCWLEQAQIKLSSVVSDLFGKSGRRMLEALLQGMEDPAELASLGDRRLHASKEQLADALTGRLTEAHRIVLRLLLQQIDQIEQHVIDLDRSFGAGLSSASGGGRTLV
jgi:hypothetical protein